MVSEPTDLDELDRLRAAATPAPWGMERQTNEHFVATNHSLRLGSERSPTWYVAAIEGRGYLADANAVLIVALVNAYPAMAAELRELREKVEYQRDLVECALAYIQANQRETPDEEEIGDCYTHLYFAAIDMATKQAEPIMQTRGPKP